jgi:lipid A ethanolaminephosphotransferase
MKRPAVHTETLLACTAAFILVAGNGPFWRAALASRPWAEPATWVFAAAVFVSLTAFYFAVVAVFSNRHTAKPLLSVLVLVSAGASYYMEHYAIYLDRTMMRNVMATNYKEASELLGWGLAGHMLLLGVLPCILLWWPVIKRRSFARAAAVRSAWVAGALALGVAALLLVFADFASLMRNHKEVRWLITPGNIIAAMTANTFGRTQHTGPRTVVGADAKSPALAPGARPRLFVLVVGETARAQNFSLNGYPRDTNPQLARRDVINFPQATACGTSTEVSLPCMFSPFGRARYDEEKILTHESVLNVLKRAGIGVLWRDNQSGCKGVCDGVTVQQLDHEADPALCADGQCFDEILLRGLDGVLRDTRGNLLVVMHQLGSHGPAYFRRYPPAMKRFTPACETDDLRRCDPATIVNAYDNSLLYTDFFLGKVIDFLADAQKTHDTAMLYVSDHGESLGEGGLYLHGVPYAIAPDVQTHVPFVMWMSPAFRSARGIDESCLRRRAQLPVSHDNLFHTLLGAFDVQTSVHDASLDLFAACLAKGR